MNFKNGTICDKHNEIIRLADLCLEDGKKMEAGLEAKRERINELEEELESVKSELEDAKKEIASLQDELADVKANV